MDVPNVRVVCRSSRHQCRGSSSLGPSCLPHRTGEIPGPAVAVRLRVARASAADASWTGDWHSERPAARESTRSDSNSETLRVSASGPARFLAQVLPLPLARTLVSTRLRVSPSLWLPPAASPSHPSESSPPPGALPRLLVFKFPPLAHGGRHSLPGPH